MVVVVVLVVLVILFLIVATVDRMASGAGRDISLGGRNMRCRSANGSARLGGNVGDRAGADRCGLGMTSRSSVVSE